MYVWNTKALAKGLRDGEISQADRFIYLVVCMLIFSIFFEVARYTNELPTVFSICESIVVILIAVVGMLWSYEKNKAGDNRELIDRFGCLSVPLFIKIVVLLVAVGPIYIAGYILLGNTWLIYLHPEN